MTQSLKVEIPTLVSLESEIDRLLSDRLAFEAFVYTPFEEAIVEIENRRKSSALENYIKQSLPAGLPHILKKEKYAFLSRDVATPNYETLRFISAIDAMEEFVPVIWEYAQDKFTPNLNELKYALGKMCFHMGQGKKGGEKTIKTGVVDFNLFSGKKISEVQTLWGQSLVDFHHELFRTMPHSLKHELVFFDASDWYSKSGLVVEKYYKKIFTLFLTHGILFENFMIENKDEFDFIRKVFLPAFIEIVQETGVKPLIVPLEPTNIEGDSFWTYYPPQILEPVKKKLDLLI